MWAHKKKEIRENVTFRLTIQTVVTRGDVKKVVVLGGVHLKVEEPPGSCEN